MMKALSLWQPWATLVAIGAKRIETRSWPTKYRGPLAIHAGKTRRRELDMLCVEPGPIRDALLANGNLTYHGQGEVTITFQIGVVVAVCDLAGCTEVGKLCCLPAYPERAFGDYRPGRFAWQLDNVRRIGPIRLDGGQRLFNVPDEIATGHPCTHCHRLATFYGPCPFNSEINDDERPVHQCASCFDEMQGQI